jgi:fermentation-respiration switch protein FrsA (DUF1100 family)
MKKLKILVGGCIGVYLCILLSVFFLQRHFLYLPPSAYASPESASGLQELSVKTKDGLDLKGWYAPATTQNLVLVYFHGNADSLKSVAPISKRYIDAGYGFLIVEHRGYSSLPGSPTEKGLYADARAFLDKLMEMGISAEAIVLMGHSLGTGVATQMATEYNVRGLMLLAPFSSIADMAQVRFPFLPASYLTIDRYDNFKKIGHLRLPLLIAVAGNDIVVPPAQGKALFERANEPKKLYFSPESGHSSLYEAELYPVSLGWLQGLSRLP